MITKRDREIVNYISEYKYATIEQLEKIFFREQQYSYNIVRRRMKKLQEAGYIKIHKNTITNKIVYILNDNTAKIAIPSEHRIFVLDVLAELHYEGYNVEEFNIEKTWLDGKIRSDAYISFTFENRRYRFFLEVQISNNKHNLQKYTPLYESEEIKEYTNSDIFPRVLLVSNRKFGDLDDIDNVNVVQVDTNLSCFSKIVI